MKFDMQALQALREEEAKHQAEAPSNAPIAQIINPQRELNKLQSALLSEAYRNENLGNPHTDGELDRGQ